MSFVFAARATSTRSTSSCSRSGSDKIGPLDMSVNKALCTSGRRAGDDLLGIGSCAWPLAEARPRQTAGEAIYELVQSQIAESSLPSKALRLWFPYVASLFLFIWVVNIVGFVPLPISNDTYEVFGVNVPTLGIYAATANLSVTLALALITFGATHVEGIRYNGVRRY